jgi:hypothetical protein
LTRDDELVISRFIFHEWAKRWSEEQRRDIERGWIDG